MGPLVVAVVVLAAVMVVDAEGVVSAVVIWVHPDVGRAVHAVASSSSAAGGHHRGGRRGILAGP